MFSCSISKINWIFPEMSYESFTVSIILCQWDGYLLSVINLHVTNAILFHAIHTSMTNDWKVGGLIYSITYHLHKIDIHKHTVTIRFFSSSQRQKKLCAFGTNGMLAEVKVSLSKQQMKIRNHHESETHLGWCNKQHSSYPDQLPP